MKPFTILIIALSLLTFSCNKDDNTTPDEVACEKDENYFTASFDGNTLEPYWQTGAPGGGRYTFFVNRDSNNPDNWQISVGFDQPDIYIYIYIMNISEVNHYDIETGEFNMLLAPIYSNTYLYISDLNSTDPNINNGSPVTFFSIEETNGIHITYYNSEKGILKGTFSCTMYNTQEEGVVTEISGQFNINMETLDNRTKPCWL